MLARHFVPDSTSRSAPSYQGLHNSGRRIHTYLKVACATIRGILRKITILLVSVIYSKFTKLGK